MKLQLTVLVLGLSLFTAACGPSTSASEAEPVAESAAVSEEALTYRYCQIREDCAQGCVCSQNQCLPDGFGPPNPDCGIAPQRACNTAQDCQGGCICRNGYCAQDGFGPPNPYCHRAP